MGSFVGLTDNGEPILITNLEPKKAVPAQVRTYTGYTIQKAFGRETGHSEAVALARAVIRLGDAGVEPEWISGGMMAAISGPTQDLTPALIEMRRHKMADEIESMRATTRLTEAGYSAIKQRLASGMIELDAYVPSIRYGD